MNHELLGTMKELPPTLSVCMIVKNEAAILERCLTSIKPASDEIIVVDTGSSDNTIEIAEKHGALVVLSQWKDDFSWSRNLSIRDAQSRWILWLDADDFVPSDSIPLINKLKDEKPNKVFGMIVRNQKPNGTGTEFIQARMFPNHPDIYFERPIHEQVMPSALKLGLTLVNTPIVIEHHGYADPEDMAKKAKRNVLLLLQNCDHTNPDQVTFIEIADSYTIMGDEENAKIWYEKVTRLPINGRSGKAIASQAYMGLGNIFNKNEKFDRAENSFQEAHKLCPERTDVLYCMAVSLELNGKKRSAADTLYKIFGMEYKTLNVGVDYRLTEIKAYLRLARLLNELNNTVELEKLCKQALKVWGSRQEIQNMAGLAYYQLNKLMDSLHCFEQSLKIVVEGNIDAYIGLCIIYLKAGKAELVDQTVNTIHPLFKSFPKYWALIDIAGRKNYKFSVSEDITQKDIDTEKQDIVKNFNLQVNILSRPS